jgi:hypothetical protein
MSGTPDVLLAEATEAELVAELNRRSMTLRTPLQREACQAELTGFQHQAEAVYYEMQRDPEAAKRFVAECAGRIA